MLGREVTSNNKYAGVVGGGNKFSCHISPVNKEVLMHVVYGGCNLSKNNFCVGFFSVSSLVPSQPGKKLPSVSVLHCKVQVVDRFHNLIQPEI